MHLLLGFLLCPCCGVHRRVDNYRRFINHVNHWLNPFLLFTNRKFFISLIALWLNTFSLFGSSSCFVSLFGRFFCSEGGRLHSSFYFDFNIENGLTMGLFIGFRRCVISIPRQSILLGRRFNCQFSRVRLHLLEVFINIPSIRYVPWHHIPFVNCKVIFWLHNAGFASKASCVAHFQSRTRHKLWLNCSFLLK